MSDTKPNVIAGAISPNTNINLPDEIAAFFSLVGSWTGFLGQQYFAFFDLQECLDRTSDLNAQILFPKPLLVVGNNGASELFFVDEHGAVFIGDELGLPDSLLNVSGSFIELLESPALVDRTLNQ